MIQQNDSNYCYYSDLPSPMAYMEPEILVRKDKLAGIDINRVIEMAWEDRRHLTR
jgi:hypothetical protein